MLSESESRYYSETFPTTFATAIDSIIKDINGKSYIDFLAGAGALNFGHNHPELVKCVLDHLAQGKIIHSPDADTETRAEFRQVLGKVLELEENKYKIIFPGPTGTNAIEVALKIARKSTSRKHVIACAGGYHGVTLGSLALTESKLSRAGAGIPLDYVHRIPFPASDGKHHLNSLEKTLQLMNREGTPAAALLFEVVQCEGGVNIADPYWMDNICQILHKHGVLCIVDEIQAGCGRTGSFLSFQQSKLKPDVICLSKSISGIGLPLSAVILDGKYDCLMPGQHSGTFRGNNLALATGTCAINIWIRDSLSTQVTRKASLVQKYLKDLASDFPRVIRDVRGIGLVWGIEFQRPQYAKKCVSESFSKGLLIERCGKVGEVVKLLPPLTIEKKYLRQGLALLRESVDNVDLKL
jgi:diaminobutyrate-2-oxoglutarate transaminase